MFVFEDLPHVDDTGIREIIQRADKKVLTIALKGASEEIRERFFENMSKRAADHASRKRWKSSAPFACARSRRRSRRSSPSRASSRRKACLTTGAAAGRAYVT